LEDPYLIQCKKLLQSHTHLEASGHPGWPPEQFEVRLREAIRDVPVSLRWNVGLKVLCACAHMVHDVPQPFYVFNLGDRTREPLCEYTLHKCVFVWRKRPGKRELVEWEKQKQKATEIEAKTSTEKYLELTRRERSERVARMVKMRTGRAYSFPGQRTRKNPIWTPETLLADLQARSW